ncbi:MAG: class II glutamine amidotransferase [Longimonas sp.]|uniref:class II glutamine amidotransferase n=1 Tax=Longimonas sp. TaxID=2039626 RepID=UPI00334BD11F
MCRLYGLHASHPTAATCELLDAQNALIDQSQQDARGLANPHGWGMARVHNGTAACYRQVGPAWESADYRSEALSLRGTTLMAHVRRATVGTPAPENTHPFRHGDTLLIHNGHIPAFEQVRPRLRERLSADRCAAIQGGTDSEHVLALLLQLRNEAPEASSIEVTRRAVLHVQRWCREVEASVYAGVSERSFADLESVPDDVLHGTLALNLLWNDGSVLAGSRLNRTLWRVGRDAPHRCPICNTTHTSAAPHGYRATVLASERITDEDWRAVPNGVVFQSVMHGDATGRFRYEPLRLA